MVLVVAAVGLGEHLGRRKWVVLVVVVVVLVMMLVCICAYTIA